MCQQSWLATSLFPGAWLSISHEVDSECWSRSIGARLTVVSDGGGVGEAERGRKPLQTKETSTTYAVVENNDAPLENTLAEPMRDPATPFVRCPMGVSLGALIRLPLRLSVSTSAQCLRLSVQRLKVSHM